MFGFKDKKVVKLEREKESLKKDVEELKESVASLKLKKKIDEEDIKHMVQLKEGRLDLEHERKLVEMEKQKDKEIHEVKNEYRDKLENSLRAELEKMDGMYTALLGRLPDVKVKMTGEVG